MIIFFNVQLLLTVLEAIAISVINIPNISE